MSKYCEYATTIDDQGCLVEALHNLGFPTVESYAKPQSLVGYHGDFRKEKAEVIIRRKHIGVLSNDIGFRRQGKAFQAVISEFDSHRFDAAWQKNLGIEFAAAKIAKLSALAGHKIKSRETIEKNGKKFVRIQVEAK